jgi:hypothetical protein
MGVALDLAASCATSGDVPVGAVVMSPHGAELGRGRNVREAHADPDRSCRGRGVARRRHGESGSVATRRLHPGGDRRALCDVCRGCGGRAAGANRLWCVGCQGRRLRVGVGPAAGPDVAACRRGRPWRAGCAGRGLDAGVLCRSSALSAGFLHRSSAMGTGFLGVPSTPVASSAVACPSGLRSAPRKRVWAQVHPGFESLRHRQVMSDDIGEARARQGSGFLLFRGLSALVWGGRVVNRALGATLSRLAVGRWAQGQW